MENNILTAKEWFNEYSKTAEPIQIDGFVIAELYANYKNRILEGMILHFRNLQKEKLIKFIQHDTMGCPTQEEIIKYTQEFDNQPIIITLKEFDEYFNIISQREGKIGDI